MELERLANFLDIQLDEQLIADVTDKCSFAKMVDKNKTFKDEFGTDEMKDGFNFFRKGELIVKTVTNTNHS